MNYEVPNSTRAKECERIQRFRCPVGQTSRSPPGIMNYELCQREQSNKTTNDPSGLIQRQKPIWCLSMKQKNGNRAKPPTAGGW